MVSMLSVESVEDGIKATNDAVHLPRHLRKDLKLFGEDDVIFGCSLFTW